MDVTDVLNEAWILYRRFFARFFVTAAVVFVPLDFAGALAAEASGDLTAAVAWGLISLVITVVGIFWVQGALVEAVRDIRDGRADTGVAELYARTRPRLPALIVAGVLAGIGVVVGLILLIVPGLYLLTRWALIGPVVVLERRSAGEAFSRSAEIVRGNGWSVFGLIVATLIGAAVARGAIRILFSWLPGFLDAWLGGVISNSLVVPFVALAWTIAYYRLMGAGRAPAAAEAAPA